MQTQLKIVCWLVVAGWSWGSPDAQAGGMHSGGGGIVGTAFNPWFLQVGDAAPIRYCVTAGAAFPQDHGELQKTFETALTYWQHEFGAAYLPNNHGAVMGRPTSDQLTVPVQTTDFISGPCAEDTDLRVQFGILSAEQRQHYFDSEGVAPSSLVGVAVRTAYDSKTLRGKGFIYISPDRGPDRFASSSSEPVWSMESGSRLNAALTHELGHVFGLQHQGTRREIMGAAFAETLVNERRGVPWPLDFFYPRFGTIFEACDLYAPDAATLQRLFSIPPADACVRITAQADGLEVFSRIGKDLPWHSVGKAAFVGSGQRRYTPAVDIWLPPDQQVFTGLAVGQTVLDGPARVQAQLTGVYRAGSYSLPVLLQIDAKHVQLSGFYEGEMVLELIPQVYPMFLSGWEWLPEVPTALP